MSPASRGSTRLQVVPGGAAEGRVPFAVQCAAVIVVTLLGVLLVNIQLSRGAYATADLRREATLLSEQEQALGESLAAAEAPDAVRARATALGMVPAGDRLFISLHDEAVIEAPPGASAPPPPAAPAPDDPAGAAP